MFKTSGGLLFQFIHLPFVIRGELRVQNKWGAAIQFNKLLFVTRKHVCSKQEGGCFLVYSLLTSIILLKCFYYEFFKNFRERCFLVFLANYIKLLRTAAFNLSSK